MSKRKEPVVPRGEIVGEMNPIELRLGMKTHKHTAKSLAGLLRLAPTGWRTVQRWLAGDTPIPGPVQVLLEWLWWGRKPKIARKRKS